jgi:glycosyltransferase involved in cell wall biosynthesis
VSLREAQPVSHSFEVVSIEGLDLPGASLRLALSEIELAVLVKPFALEYAASNASGEDVTFLHGACWMREPAIIFAEPMDRFDIEIVPALPLSIGRAKNDMATALEAGLGRPTGSLLRLKPSDSSKAFLKDWQEWIRTAYVLQPTDSLVDAERHWLEAAPGWHPDVGWNHHPVMAHWADLRSSDNSNLIDTGGFVEYLHSVGQSFYLMARNTHDPSSIDELARRITEPWTDEPAKWASGKPFTDLARSLLRAIDPLGTRWATPADDLAGQSLRSWMLDVDSRGLPRFAQALYWSRPDLQDAFPPGRTPVRDFVHWLAKNRISVDGGELTQPGSRARSALHAIGKSLGLATNTLASRRESAERAEGINVVGYAAAETGLGEAMRGTLRALASGRREPAVLDLSDHIYVRRQGSFPGRLVNIGTPMDVTIFHLNPTELVDYAKQALAFRLAANRNIGFFFWETEKIPNAWHRGCEMVDEIWVASDFLRRAFAKTTSKPIHVMGMAVEPPPTTTPDRSRYGMKQDDFVVSYVTDAYSGLQRKDPLRAIEAFELAFGPCYEGVHLLLKIGNLEKFPELRASLKDRTRDKPITIVDTYLHRGELWDLLACSDVYLSLHSSEGFGLTILEAMALGIPPIVTAYGGNMDFTNADNSLLVGYDMVPATGGPGNIYAGNGMWARPDIGEASRHLARVRADRELLEVLGRRAKHTAADHDSARYRRNIESRLDALVKS